MALILPTLAIAAPDRTPPADTGKDKDAAQSEAKAPEPARQKALFSTGVAKGRDLLDSAISTSAIGEAEVTQIGARSLGEVLRSVPGFRVEATGDTTTVAYTIRGLPLTGFGSKNVQFQEDGLPVLEFGDLALTTPDTYLRPDLTLNRIESIRGGSASTFASNSPGGVINFISRTGEEEGGSVMLTAGLNYGEHRVDFDYGGRLSDNLRFNVGGFYRQGSGPRDPGYSAFKGGQVKLNITREFANGYVRVYAKLLDDRVPGFLEAPIKITGTNANPTYSNFPSFNIRNQVLYSNNTRAYATFNGDGNVETPDNAQGLHPISKSIGLEARFELSGWTFTERMRYSSNSATLAAIPAAFVAPAPLMAMIMGGPGATLSYGTGAKKGQVIADPATLNGNGLLVYGAQLYNRYRDQGNFINDFRGTRVWKLGAGDLTFTAGVYKSVQQVNMDSTSNAVLMEVNGTDTALIDVRTASGVPVTANGKTGYTVAPLGHLDSSRRDVEYDITAPYGSINYHIGKLAIGGSLRYDSGKVRGQLFGAALGGDRIGQIAYDINRDGAISVPETRVGVIPTDSPMALDYDYNYVSYSVGANYRVGPGLAFFGRYSRGARAAADTFFFTPSINVQTGTLANPADAYDVVRQSEMGVKYRSGNLALNLTGFLANAHDKNFQILNDANGQLYSAQIDRNYRAYGAEFEGSYFYGPWNLTAAATYTHARIRDDKDNPEFVDKTPRHQPKLIAQVAPSYVGKMFSAGGTVIYTGSSYAQDLNLLKMPAYTTVNAFVQIRPVDRVELMVTASNLFDTLGLVNVIQSAIPASGIGTATVINGRTVAGSIRFRF
ncbi:TonB-dependent receptor domain-containing protein [Sphingomonas hengshuiensis]|uniref:TonB-dependent receptor n=1 Tax=Sphingomonas hengshuiensis TaxID=1609977 RepID=A0A7U5CUM5_9SPHN|nr:TonB-dependent receptor [Sphingomonas hengshuiensis]AJP70669.1 hypothetical protein TS85_00715 [Sphingomonas hengshuiensis]